MLYLDIFTPDYVDRTPVTGITMPSDINYLRKLYKYNSDQIHEYYITRNFTVKNTHIISRIIEHFPVHLNYDNYRYLEYAEDKIKYLAKHFKFTSEIERGIVHPPYLFGNDGDEIIIASYELFNVNEFVRNWKNESSIKVLKHCRNDTKLLLPLGTNDGSRSGLSVVMINIPKLALQYREFIREQTAKLDTGVVLNKNHFVIKYVLSNMIKDIIDHMLLNKVMDRFYGNYETITPKIRHRFKIFEPTTQLDRYLDQTIHNITNKSFDFLNLLHNVQLAFSGDAANLLKLPNIGYTQQVKWALFVSRVDYMIFLCNVSKSKNANKHYLNDWKRLATRIQRDNLLDGIFSYEIEKDLKEKLDMVATMA